MLQKIKPPKSVALIPARSGSKRVGNKNIRELFSHPLIAYTITAAQESGIFDDVIVSTDSDHYAEIAAYYGAQVPFLRPGKIAGGLSPDYEWIHYTLERLSREGHNYDCFSILRPTSPFRQPHTIKRAWNEFHSASGIDSLRAIEKCAQHPGKMWVVRDERMLPLLPLSPTEQPWHSSQYQSLPEVYVQNASLEIAWTRVVFQNHSISGTVIKPFFTTGYEGFDINTPYDWEYAEHLINNCVAELPGIPVQPFKKGNIVEVC